MLLSPSSLPSLPHQSLFSLSLTLSLSLPKNFSTNFHKNKQQCQAKVVNLVRLLRLESQLHVLLVLVSLSQLEESTDSSGKETTQLESVLVHQSTWLQSWSTSLLRFSSSLVTLPVTTKRWVWDSVALPASSESLVLTTFPSFSASFLQSRIIPRHLQLAIRNDEELNKLLGGVTISQGGVLPFIQAEREFHLKCVRFKVAFGLTSQSFSIQFFLPRVERAKRLLRTLDPSFNLMFPSTWLLCNCTNLCYNYFLAWYIRLQDHSVKVSDLWSLPCWWSEKPYTDKNCWYILDENCEIRCWYFMRIVSR